MFLVDLKSYTLQFFYLRVNIMTLKLVKFNFAESSSHFQNGQMATKAGFANKSYYNFTTS